MALINFIERRAFADQVEQPAAARDAAADLLATGTLPKPVLRQIHHIAQQTQVEPNAFLAQVFRARQQARAMILQVQHA